MRTIMSEPMSETCSPCSESRADRIGKFPILRACASGFPRTGERIIRVRIFLKTLPERKCLEAAEFPPELYHDFMNYGFRRSGMYFYRPVCEACSECRPIRILAGEYRLTKSHRRILRKNREVDVRIASPRFTKDKFRIYSDYLASQHGCGPDHSADSLRSFPLHIPGSHT